MWWDEEEAAVVPSGSLINLWYPVEAAFPSEVCVCIHTCACVPKELGKIGLVNRSVIRAIVLSF